ncbi:MAG: hypothetical protein Q8O66_01110 [bacterium]|nr:hypothetical protein [bacterium]
MFTGDWGNANQIRTLFDAGKTNSGESWAKEIFGAANDEAKFQKTKATSPFAGNVVIVVSYGIHASFGGDISSFVNANGGIDVVSSIVKNAIRSKGWSVHDFDDYLLAFDQLSIFGNKNGAGNVEVFWMGSRNGAKSPESAQRGIRK